MSLHVPVMLKEVLDNLLKKRNGIYVDATLGFGGHTKHILNFISSGKVIGIDRDMDVFSRLDIEDVLEKNIDKKVEFKPIKANFSSLDVVLEFFNIDRVDGILADIGVSSYQIDVSSRGFSYISDGPLDMRMDRESKIDAKYVINKYSEEDLANVIYNYGEERRSRKIARAIVKEREKEELVNSSKLVEVILSKSDFNSVKRVFQAIRIEVNQELRNLEIFLEKSLDRLNIGGRIAIITFHSLEDRIVKHFFKNSDRVIRITKKAITATKEEIENNSRSSSAKLRVAERVL